ncbi:MAG: zinc ribbon domain-containing protein [Clostridia bacterium]|nr:zinc ribbon domain-containing protein [Clostridia bacterium]
MICHNCGSQIPDDSIYCLNCGVAIQPQTPSQPNMLHYYDPNGFSAKLRKELASPLFLVICILLTAAALPISGLPVLAILFAVAAWMTYTNAKNGTPVMDVGGLKFISGTMTASYIINWVLFGLMVFSTVIILVMLPFVILAEAELQSAFNSAEYMEMYREILSIFMSSEDVELFMSGMDLYMDILEFIYNNMVLVFVISAVFCVLFTVGMGIFNGVFYARFKNLAKGMSEAYLKSDARGLSFKGVSGLLMATGIVRLVVDFINLILGLHFSSILSACLSVTFILASMWVKQLKASLDDVPVNNTAYAQNDNGEQMQ